MSVRARLGRIYRDACAPIHFALSRAELRRAMPERFSAEAIWDLTTRYRGYGWFRDMSAWQIKSEYVALMNWAAARKPRVIVEIGTAKGGTLIAWSYLASEMVVSVDLPGGIHGGGYNPHKELLFREFACGASAPAMKFFRGDSHSEVLRDEVGRSLGPRRVDLLFIDGDHTLEGVTRDFELWSPLVARGGHVAFHDIVPHHDLAECQVDVLWRSLKARYPSIEFIEDENQGWAGIGVLEMTGAR